MTVAINRSIRFHHWLAATVLVMLAAVLLTATPASFAQSERELVAGVKNFGRVTETYFRGGAITPEGIDNLSQLGVRTIIDLRDSPNADEPIVSQRKGIKYLNFPMTGHDTPSDKTVSEILSIIQNAKEPVYVHCSAGKHRAGTIAALYRMRVQGWSEESAWAEQQSYGFGTSEEHPALYAYAYGAHAQHSDLSKAQASKQFLKADDKKEKISSKEKKKEDKLLKAKKKDDDDDDNRDNEPKKEHLNEKDKKKDKARITTVTAPKVDGARKSEAAQEEVTARTSVAGGLSAEAAYITVAEAIETAQVEGGSGQVLKVDLEWDPARTVATWDVTFSSGNEYEIDAVSGKLLGAKPKPPAKLAVFSPLELDRNRLLTFQAIIRKAETNRGQRVMEMELKRIKGRSEAIYEVVLADGSTLFYDAATGNTVNGI